jgi:calcineurin-like phosphoesterase family protein
MEDLRRELQIDDLDIIVISGDVSNTAAPEEFEQAEEFVKAVQAETGEPDVLIVPGNHDLSWTASRRAYTPVRRSEMPAESPSDAVFKASDDYVELANNVALKRRFVEFGRFHRAVTAQEYPLDPAKQFTSLSVGGVAVYGLNSSWQVDHHFTARASISETALARVLALIRREGSRDEIWCRIAVWHHPVEDMGEGTLRNPEIVDQLAKAGFKMILHGHTHRPMRGIREFDVAGPRQVVSVGAGTFGAVTRDWTPGFPLGYNCLSIYGDRVVLSSRKRETENGPWVPDARWRQGRDEDPSSSFTVWRGDDIYSGEGKR